MTDRPVAKESEHQVGNALAEVPIVRHHDQGATEGIEQVLQSRKGLDVEVIKTAGWAVIRDKTINKEYDAAHMLSPMPLAITMGVGSNPQPYTMPAVENINGQAITLSVKHKDKRNPKDWKGFKFAVPFDFSMHNYLLRYYLAEHGIDPDADVQIRAVPPPEMVANLRADNIDGFLGPDPMNQRAVYDGVGKDTFLKSLDCLAPLGVAALFGQSSGSVEPLNLGLLAQKGSLYVTRPTLNTYAAKRANLVAMANELFEVVKSGAVKIEVHQTYPLKDAAKAHADLAARKTTGSTVLTV